MTAGEEGLIQLYAKALRLPTVADCAAIVREATQQRWGYEEFLRAVLQRELEQRQDNQRKRRVKTARFPQIKTLDTFDFGWLIWRKRRFMNWPRGASSRKTAGADVRQPWNRENSLGHRAGVPGLPARLYHPVLHCRRTGD